MRPVHFVAAALVLLVAGFWMAAEGDARQAASEVAHLNSSTAIYGDLLGFDGGSSSQATERAREMESSGETLSTVGQLFMITAVVLFVLAVAKAYALRQRALPSGKATPAEVTAQHDANDRNPCPRCGESIPVQARMCRFCQLDL